MKPIGLALLSILLVSLIPPVEAQLLPAVELECMSPYPSGAIEVEVEPGSSLTGFANCIVSNPNPYVEKIEIEVNAEGLVVAAPGSVTVGPNSEVEFQVTIRAEQGMMVSTRTLNVKATVVEANGVPPPNIAESEVNMIVEILQFGEVLVHHEVGEVTIEAGEKVTLTYMVFNMGNGRDTVRFRIDDSYREKMGEAGFQISIGNSEHLLDPYYGSEVLVTITAPGDIGGDVDEKTGKHRLYFMMGVSAESDFSCKYGKSGCNTHGITTTLIIEQEAHSVESLAHISEDPMMMYGAIGGGVFILLLILFVVIRKNL